MDYLFGKWDGFILRDLEILKEYDVFEKWIDEQWCVFLKKWIFDVYYVFIFGKLLYELVKKFKVGEEECIVKRKEEFGKEGFEVFKNKFEIVKQNNEKLIFFEVLDQWLVFGIELIYFIEFLIVRLGKVCVFGVLDNKVQKIIDVVF